MPLCAPLAAAWSSSWHLRVVCSPYPVPLASLARSSWYTKTTAWITSPRVKAIARRDFGCSTLRGMALEDLPIDGSFGSHWEARLMGPEVAAPHDCSLFAVTSDPRDPRSMEQCVTSLHYGTRFPVRFEWHHSRGFLD
jgi:hypothetical protein